MIVKYVKINRQLYKAAQFEADGSFYGWNITINRNNLNLINKSALLQMGVGGQ